LAMGGLCSVLQTGAPNARYILIVGLAGFAGMLLDSLLGALLQARYIHPTGGQESDRPLPGFVRRSGCARMSNDGVNFWSNSAVTACCLAAAWFGWSIA
jgi:uncharacterized membrane protein